MATNGDVPDDSAESLMAAFYARENVFPDLGSAFALREAPLSELRKDGRAPREIEQILFCSRCAVIGMWMKRCSGQGNASGNAIADRVSRAALSDSLIEPRVLARIGNR